MRPAAADSRATTATSGDDVATLVLVTGGSRGIGAALVAAAPSGARVVQLSRSAGDGRAVHRPVDLATREGLRRAGEVVAREVAAFAGDRLVLVHAAGTLDPIGFAGEVHGERVLDNAVLNSVAPQVVGHAFLAAARRHPASRAELVHLSSGAATSTYPGWATYCAAKAAVEHWTRTVGEEQRHRAEHDGARPVTVLAVAPGVVDTGMQDRIRSTAARDFPRVDKFRALHADGALLAPDDVAARTWALLDDPPPTGTVLDLRDR